MASGAYWIGSASNEVYASPSTMVGSIGVYTILRNVAKAAEQQGVKFHVFRAGDLKAAGNPYEEMNSEQLESLQKRVDDIYQNFVGEVAEFRNTTVEAVVKDFGRGSVFLAPEAKDRGMIDGVSTFQEVLDREVASISNATKTVVISTKGNEMNERVNAALLARGFIETMSVSDEAAFAAQKTWCKINGIGEELSDEALTEAILVKSTTSPESFDDSNDDNVGDLAVAERARIQALHERSKLVPGVTEEHVTEAIESGTAVKDAVDGWVSTLSKVESPLDDLQSGDTQSEKVEMAAGAIFAQRAMPDVQLTDEERGHLRNYGNSFQNMRTLDILRTSMRSRGLRVSHDDVTDARAILSQSGDLLASEGSVNRRGDHPDALSSLTRKSLNQGAIESEPTYTRWAARFPDLPDFKPASFIDVGVFATLDALSEDEKTKQLKFDSSQQNWIKTDKYANKCGLTVEMVVDDSLGVFARQLRSMGFASKSTVRKVMLDQFASNPTMPDGNAFFSAAHNNLITSGGGAPSAAAYAEHRKKHRLQTSYGSENPMGLTFTRILVPAAHEFAAEQTTASGIVEAKTPQTDATVNTFRGRIETITEAYLDDYDVNSWYTLVDPMVTAAMYYAYQRGFGEMGQQTDWFDPDTGTRYFSIEVRFGGAMANRRAMIKNPGQ